MSTGGSVSPIGAVLQFVWDNFLKSNVASGAKWGWKTANVGPNCR